MIREKYVYQLRDTTINITNSMVESIRFKDITKTSIRVYKDGLIGVAGAIGNYDEDSLTRDAVEALKQKIAYPCEPSINFSKSVDMRKPIISGNQFLKEIEGLLEELTKKQPNFIFSNKICLSGERHHIDNESGLTLDYSDKAFRFELLFKEKSSANVFDGFFGFEERYYDRQKILEQMNMLLNAYTNPVDLPKGDKMPVIFFKNSFPIGKLITDLRGDIFATGGSIFSGKLGQRLFSEDLTLFQTLNPETVINAPFFDAEGVVNLNYRFNFIENGVLKAPYTDKRLAKKYGLVNTGSSEAPYDGVPSVSFRNWSMTPLKKTVKALLGGQPGIFVLVAEGGDFTPDGGYATPVQLAMLFDGEKFIGRLPEMQISGSIYSMLGEGFRGMGSDTVFPFSTEKMIVTEMTVSL
jgi:PmbA protein